MSKSDWCKWHEFSIPTNPLNWLPSCTRTSGTSPTAHSSAVITVQLETKFKQTINCTTGGHTAHFRRNLASSMVLVVPIPLNPHAVFPLIPHKHVNFVLRNDKEDKML